jgi:hypothetical protein
MRVSNEVVESGLRMLQDRRRMLGQPDQIIDRDRQRVAAQVEMSQEPWREARQILQNHGDLMAILEELWPDVVPYLIKGNEVSPVHHIAYVVRFMAQISLTELPENQRKTGLVAALLHDIGIGDCSLPKISEHSIQRATGEERNRLRRDGIESRLEHMKKGAEISRGLLLSLQQRNPTAVSDPEIETILEIVRTHDYSKIPLMEDHVDRKWLLTSGREDWLKQCHWEADALWMLSPAGILVDLEREREEVTTETKKAKFDFNLGLHREIISLYAKAYSPEEMKLFGFRDGLLYRSATGYGIAMGFQRQAGYAA